MCVYIYTHTHIYNNLVYNSEIVDVFVLRHYTWGNLLHSIEN